MIPATEGLSPANAVKCQSHLKELEKMMEPRVPSWLRLECGPQKVWEGACVIKDVRRGAAGLY